MKVCVLGLGRSGTTALYGLIQEVLTEALSGDVDFVYEPFLWDRSTFNDRFENVRSKFKTMDAVSAEGIFHHLSLPLYVDSAEAQAPPDFLRDLFLPRSGKRHLLAKIIRGNGRFAALREAAGDCRFIFIIRNPVDVVNSVITRFSFFGGEFHRDDLPRFLQQTAEAFPADAVPSDRGSEVENAALYWYYMNRHFLEVVAHSGADPLLIAHERFTTDRAKCVERICGYLDLEYRPEYGELAEREVGGTTKEAAISRADLDSLLEWTGRYLALCRKHGIDCPEGVEESIRRKYLDSCVLPTQTRSRARYYGLTPLHLQSRAINAEDQVDRLRERLKEKNATIADRNTAIAAQREKIKVREATIRSLREENERLKDGIGYRIKRKLIAQIGKTRSLVAEGRTALLRSRSEGRKTESSVGGERWRGEVKKLDLIVIGAQKSGTSSLHHYLDRHPDIYMSKPLKEPRYFMPFDRTRAYYERATRIRLQSPEDLYENYMLKEYNGQRYFGESSTDYTIADWAERYGLPHRIRDHNPAMKLIYILRNPMERLVSNYLHDRNKNRHDRATFSSYVDAEWGRLVRTSFYHYQLSQYLECFPRDQIAVLLFEEFTSDTEGAMRTVFSFLDLTDRIDADYGDAHNVSKNRSAFKDSELRLDVDTYHRLMRELRRDVEKLAEIIGDAPLRTWDLSESTWCA